MMSTDRKAKVRSHYPTGPLVQVTGVQLRHTWCNGGDCIMMQVDSLEVTGCAPLSVMWCVYQITLNPH